MYITSRPTQLRSRNSSYTDESAAIARILSSTRCQGDTDMVIALIINVSIRLLCTGNPSLDNFAIFIRGECKLLPFYILEIQFLYLLCACG